ncbi:phosphopantetheine-binding protein [Paenibacillus sp. YYML68]|uniref:phosphopantetheine-binding protein n=1 Tax=Paenibacillus sp. YYML68 TaxID=2909250 RepID=UPI0024903E5C|nr:phosphopantetheine-binding protein [Paenibacillus sp. YYML68]
MSRVQWTGQLREVMTKHLQRPAIPPLTEELRLNEDLGLDSVMLLQLLVWIEVEIGLPIPEEEVDPRMFSTVGSLLDFMEQCSRGGKS